MSTLYLVRSTVVDHGARGHGAKAWAGSMAEVRAAKAEMMSAHGLRRADLAVEEVEVEFGKKGVLALLNGKAK